MGAAVIISRPAVVLLFSPDADVQALLATVLILVALQQPIAGVVFVLDGVLIGAGDGRYLAWAGVVNFIVFAPLALAVLWTDSGLIALWFAFIAFMTARMGTLLWRERGDRWVVLGAAPSPHGFRADETRPGDGTSQPTR
jgi:Na+-driven multidrug efflux pump